MVQVQQDSIRLKKYMSIFRNFFTMGRKKKYPSETEKKAALALNKKSKRSTAKEQKKSLESTYQWISQYLLDIANQVTQKVERRTADAKQKAKKRLAMKKPVTLLSAEERHQLRKEKNKERMRELRAKAATEKMVAKQRIADCKVANILPKRQKYAK